jgi:hypothetical protein
MIIAGSRGRVLDQLVALRDEAGHFKMIEPPKLRSLQLLLGLRSLCRSR